MRLTASEIAAIKGAARRAFGPDAVVRVFGSRIDDQRRGGDIDLHLEVGEGQEDVEHAARFRWDIYEQLDERPMDLVFHVRGRPLRSIDRAAHVDGIVL